MPYERAAGGYMAARKASKKVINFFVVGLTYGWRRPCRVTWALMPAAAKAALWAAYNRSTPPL